MSTRLDTLARVYGPTTWAVYDLLDESLAPRGPESLTESPAPTWPRAPRR